MEFIYSDGGRSEAGYKGNAKDCVVRSIAIVTRIPYKKVYEDLNRIAKLLNNKSRISTSRGGVHKDVYNSYLRYLGYEWIPTMKIGQGCKVHLKADELPEGRLIVRISRHMTAVIDGIHYDAWNQSKNGTRCVYGYFKKK